MRPFNCWTRFDHATRRATNYFAGPDSIMQECCFVPRHARRGRRTVISSGVVNRWLEVRSDLLVLDATRLEDGPLATVRLPTRIHPQIHGWWVPDDSARARGKVAPSARQLICIMLAPGVQAQGAAMTEDRARYSRSSA